MHYLFFSYTILTFSFIFLELTKFALIFMISYFYTSEAADLLPSKQFWQRFMQIILIFGMIFEGFFLIAFIVKRSLSDVTSMCTDPFFIILRSGGQIMILVFLIIGIQITKKVMHFQRSTEYEKTKQLKEQFKALKNLWCVTNIFWHIPIIYVFLPKLLFRDKHIIKEHRTINATNSIERTPLDTRHSKNSQNDSLLDNIEDESIDDEEIFFENNYYQTPTSQNQTNNAAKRKQTTHQNLYNQNLQQDTRQISLQNYIGNKFAIVNNNQRTSINMDHENRPSLDSEF
eukprot:403359603